MYCFGLINYYYYYYYYYNRFMSPWTVSGTTQVSRYQKGKTNLDLLEQEIVSDSGISWAICKSAQTNNHASIPLLNFLQAGALRATQPTVSKH